MTKTLRILMILLLTWIMMPPSEASDPESSFSLECPGDVQVSCTAELWDLSIYGNAYIWEHYVKRDAGPPTRVERNLNSCGVGEIRRIWEVEDPYWNIVSCTQVIRVGAAGSFGAGDIVWPENLDTSGCVLDLDPYKLPKKNAIPRFKKVACSKPGYSYKDRVFTINGGCKKIIRTWEVVDCCIWDPDDPWGQGFWKHHQIIKIIQRDTPEIKNCPKKIVVDAKTCSGTYVDLDTVVAVDQCGHALKVWHNSPYADTSKGPDATGTYPIGTTKFYYMTKYACGKVIKCPVTITVKNNLQPRVYCRSGVITTLMGMDTDGDGVNDEGMVEIWAKDLDRGSAPKCKGRRLWFSFSSDTSDMSRVFTCENVGENEVQMWVTDEFGNQTYCITKVIVQNNAARIVDCMPDSLRPKIHHLAGRIAERDYTAMAGAKVYLEDTQPQMVITSHWDTSIVETRDTFIGKSGNQYIRIHRDTTLEEQVDTTYRMEVYSAVSDAEGIYELDSIPKWRSYTLYAHMGGDPMEGVTTNDLMRLLEHISGISPIQDPYAYIAADLNGDGRLDREDYQLLLSALLPFGAQAPAFEAWKMIDAHVSIDLSNPLDYTTLEKCSLESLDGDRDEMDFVAIKMGDIDHMKGRSFLFRERSPVYLSIGGEILGSDGTRLLPLYLHREGILSGQVQWHLPASLGQHVEAMDGTATLEVAYDREASQLSIVWLDPFPHPEGMPIGYLRVSDPAVLPLFQEIQRSSPEVGYGFDQAGGQYAVHLRRAEDTYAPKTDAIEIGPNPFSTYIRLRLSEEWTGETMAVEIIDLMGHSVVKWQGLSSRPLIELSLPSHLPPRLYLVKIRVGDSIITHKMVKINK